MKVATWLLQCYQYISVSFSAKTYFKACYGCTRFGCHVANVNPYYISINIVFDIS